MRLKGKTALITGASQGIGRATAVRFACEGATVAINYLPDEGNENLTKAGHVAAELEELGAKTLLIAADVTCEEAAKAMISQVITSFGKLDILVNNAGILRDITLKKMTREQWDAVIDVNLGALFNCCKPASIHMRDRGEGGAIINLSSVVGLSGNLGQTNYCAAKAGVIGFTKALARELGKYRVRVNAVAPGFIDTDMTRDIEEEIKAKYRDAIPLLEFGKPEDVADAILFLASSEARYITGHVLSVNGGWYM